MAKVTFDGPNLLIIAVPGVVELDVEADLYSEWKDWAILTDNLKYPPAFRTVGGDPLTPGIDAGAYFFLQNQSGWRIKPAEEDATVLVAGNLASEDSSKPILVPTDGDFSVLYQGLQPITQSVEAILLQQQDAAYNGTITIDFENGSPGTAYPLGLASSPVNNVDDGFRIAQNLGGLRNFSLLNGTYDLDRDATSYTFVSKGGTVIFNTNGYNVSGSVIQGCAIQGADFSNSSNVSIVQGSINGATGFHGSITQSGLDGRIYLQPGKTLAQFSYSIGASEEDHVSFFFGNGGTGASGYTDLTMKSFSGSVSVHNMINDEDHFNVDAISAKIEIEPDCLRGHVITRGTGYLVDKGSSNIQFEREGFIEGTDIIQLREGIYVDPVAGEPGTGENVGISTNPVDNITDGYLLAIERGSRQFIVDGPISLQQDMEGFVFRGRVTKNTAIIDLNGHSVDNSEFINLTLGGTGAGEVLVRESKMENLAGVSGIFKDSGILDFVLPGDNTTTTMINCFSEVPGSGTPVLDLGDMIDSDLQVRGYHGGLRLKNIDVPTQAVSIDMDSGHLYIDDTNIDGQIVVRGSGYITDESNGTEVITKGLLGNAVMQSAYNDKVSLDPNSQWSGTDYPIGTEERPVNNLDDALQIMDDRGFSKLQSFGTFVVGPTADISGRKIIGKTKLTSVVVLSPGCNTDKAEFYDCILTGEANGSIYAENAGVQSLTNLGDETTPTVFNRCILSETISMRAGLVAPADMHIIDSTSGEPTAAQPIIDMNGTTTPIGVRKYDGDLTFINQTGGNNLEVNLISGNVTFDGSCTSGTVKLDGVGGLVDNSATLTIDNNLVDFATTNTILNNIASDLARVLGLSQHNYRITNQTYSGTLMTSSTVRLYPSKADADADTNHTYEYVMSASYDGQGRLTGYKMTEA